MTMINKLVLDGFKSFAKRKEVILGKDFNCVLGPNGSGKSNILDALCFVLGKTSTKSLRAEKAANLIYNGGKTKNPSNKAEVSIFFDNHSKVFPTEDNEVKITRIVKKTGQSVYKINDQTRTRQQIIELLSLARIDPDGYNIILQGDIVKFVEMSPDERRKLVEEISGISIYEEKKQKAVHELEKVDTRLREADIVLTERETYLSELKKERDQANKYQNLNNRIKVNKATFLHRQIEEKGNQKQEFDEKTNSRKKKIEEVNSEIKKIKEKIEQNKKEIEDINKEIESKGEKEQVALHKEVEELKIEFVTSKDRIESHKNEINKIEQRKEQLKQNTKDTDEKIKSFEKERDELKKQLKGKEKEIKEVEDRIAEFKKKNLIDDAAKIEKQIDDIDKAAEEKLDEIQQLREDQQELIREKDQISFKIQSFDEQIGRFASLEKESKTQLDELKKKKDEFKKATSELNKLTTEQSSLESQLLNARKKLHKAKEELEKLKAKSFDVKENVLADIAVKRILEQKHEIGGIYGTVAELGRVSSKYALALEIAAGPRIKSIVVEDDKIAATCIKYLKNNKLGVATFLPLNKIRPKPVSPEIAKIKSSNGVHGLAVELVSYHEKFKKVFSYVFGNTLIVDDIDTIRRLGVGSARMATLDGDIAEISGAMQGGFRKKRPSFTFMEKEVTKSLSEQEKIVGDSENLVKTFDKRRTEIDERISKLRNEKAALEGDVIKLEKSLHIESGDIEDIKKQKQTLGKDLEGVENTVNELQADIDKFKKELEKDKQEKQELRKQISEIRDPQLVAELNAFEEKRQELRENIIQLNLDIKNFDTQVSTMLGPEKENIFKILKQHEKEQEQFKEEIKKLSEKIKEYSENLKKKEETEKKFYARFKDLFNKRTKIGDGINKDQTKVEGLMEQTRKEELRVNTTSLEAARISGELAGLEKDYEDYRGVKVDKEKSDAQLKREITQFENMVANLGSVNLKALEIYDNIEKEYKQLLDKKNKLGKEKEDVLVMMNEIETKKKALFTRTFDAVTENFKRIFSLLTTKGDAYLELENPESPFEGGIEIKVKITSRKFMDIRSLSGGEKTLTALSFIFAIQEHEPASFYVLDEVDAALDKHNSERFAKLIRKYSRNAQYLIISHNDQVVSEADNLYGISMDEHGKSNIVSLKI